MPKYHIDLRYYDSQYSENLFFIDHNDNKKIKDLKEFITSFNDLICSCMLVIQNKSSFFSFQNDEYYNDDIELKKISKNRKISIIQNSKKCKCKFLLENEKLLKLPKKSLIDKLNNLKELTYDYSNINNFYDINIKINTQNK